ncbi:MAG: hypothetical protein CV081_03460 [Nitrospira sp. LK265]|nr:hypothetical protein [Nitrospira sp. LK265]
MRPNRGIRGVRDGPPRLHRYDTKTTDACQQSLREDLVTMEGVPVGRLKTVGQIDATTDGNSRGCENDGETSSRQPPGRARRRGCVLSHSA